MKRPDLEAALVDDSVRQIWAQRSEERTSANTALVREEVGRGDIAQRLRSGLVQLPESGEVARKVAVAIVGRGGESGGA